MIELLGKPSRQVDYPRGEVGHFYEESGIVFFTKDKLVQGLGINFNWDGDKKFPEKTFTGSLKLGESSLTKDTKNADIAAIQSVAFTCPIPLICASKDRTAKIISTVAFKDELLTQVVFLIKE